MTVSLGDGLLIAPGYIGVSDSVRKQLRLEVTCQVRLTSLHKPSVLPKQIDVQPCGQLVCVMGYCAYRIKKFIYFQ